MTDNEKELIRLVRACRDPAKAAETAIAILLAFWEQEKGKNP